MSNPSLWREASVPSFSPVDADMQFDVVVVGGGLAGLVTAYLLKEAGQTVCVLERERVGAIETGNTTAHLTYVTDRRLSELAKTFGEDGARLAWMGGQAAIRDLESLATRAGCDCDFRRVPGHLHLPISCDDSARDTRSEAEELASEADFIRKLGFEAKYLEQVPGLLVPGIEFQNQAQFHPLKFLAGLARAVEGDGCRVFEHSAVTETESEPLAVRAHGHRIACGRLVIMTHVPLMGNAGTASAALFQTKLAAYTSYAVSARTTSGRFPMGLYSDTNDPYRYLRLQPEQGFDQAILGGEDHKTGQADDADERYRKLEGALLKLLPDALLTHRWCGQVIETPDGLPYMGETAPGQFAATGFSGNGMTWGALAATMACDWVLGNPNPWQDLLSVDRVKIRGAALDYLKENIDYPYYLLRGKLKPSEGKSLDELAPGEAKILNMEGKKYACFRDDEGGVHAVSAICTHMGCVVQFNHEEQTWDCPCHGSRFQVDGQVSTGPAETPLEPLPSAVAPN